MLCFKFIAPAYDQSKHFLNETFIFKNQKKFHLLGKFHDLLGNVIKIF